MTHARTLALLLATLLAVPAAAEPLRVAAYDVGLDRDGPGLLLAELRAEPKPELAAVLAVIRATRPDILLLSRFDTDLRGEALTAFRHLLAAGPDGIEYRHAYSAPVNAGVDSGLDLDGDGLRLGPRDALGWGRFPGNGGMALLSRFPIDDASSHAFTRLRWADLPDADLPAYPDGAPYFDAAALERLPLSSRAHWDLAVSLPNGARLHLLASNPTPPLFDGPERLNRRRNADEIRFWTRYLDGAPVAGDRGETAHATGPLVVLGDLNLDPEDGAGTRAAIRALLAHPRLADPRPESAGAERAATPDHLGAPERDTAQFSGRSGNLRTDYVLPSRDLVILGSGVVWPAPGAPLADLVAQGPAHRLVWVDLAMPEGDAAR